MIDKKSKILIIRLIISIILWIIGIIFLHIYNIEDELLFDYKEIIVLIIFSLSYLIIGYEVLINAIKNIFKGKLLDENFLMAIASLGAFFIRFLSKVEYSEASAIMIFYQVGELFQHIAVTRSKNKITDVMNLKVTKCHLESNKDIKPEDVNVNDIILVYPGEVVPVDGLALTSGVINQASLTGEAIDISINENDNVLSGSINKYSVLKIKVLKKYEDSTAAKIIEMVENSTFRKSKSEKIISKFAHIYTPIVVAIALTLALVIPTILGLINGFSKDLFKDYLYVSLLCLVVSCPCALVVSIPLTYFAGIGAAAKEKIIIKGSTYLDSMSNVKSIIVDKTGTITNAKFVIDEIISGDKLELMKIAKGLEINSNHPLAEAIKEYDTPYYEFKTYEEPGLGIKGIKDDINYYIGSYKLMKKYNINIKNDEKLNVLYVAKENNLIGYIKLKDQIKKEAKEMVNSINRLDKEVIILSGDNKNNVIDVANELNIKKYYYELLPLDKVSKAEEIIKENNKINKKTAFVGDGINDAPVLALADVGISMGSLGSDAAIEASDIVILNDNLLAILKLIKISKKTKRIVYENIFISIGIKVIILLLAIISNLSFMNKFEVPMWLAIFGDVGILVIAILNALRALKIK